MTRPNLKLAKPPKRPSIALLRQAVRLYSSPYVSREQNKANRVSWLRSIHALGDGWVLAGRKEVSWGAKERKA